MPIVYLLPTAEVDSTVISTGVFTDVDEGVDGGTPDGNLETCIGGDLGGGGATWNLDDLPAEAISVNSYTLRARAQITGTWSDDTVTYRFYLIGTNVALTGTGVFWDFESEAGNALADKTSAGTDSPTVANINGAQVRFTKGLYSKSMQDDGAQCAWDGFELEIDYNIGLTAEAGSFSVTSPNETEIYQFGDFITGGLTATGATTQVVRLLNNTGRTAKSGNLLLVLSASIQPVTSTPTGYTPLNNSLTGAADWNLYYKVSVGTETSVTIDYDASTATEVLFIELAWNGLTPILTENENETNISTAVQSQASGAATPVRAKNIIMAFHGAADMSANFTGQATDGAWTEEIQFQDFASPGFRVSKLVNVTGSQEATHSDTDADLGSEMYGAIAVFDVPDQIKTDAGSFSITGQDAKLYTFGEEAQGTSNYTGGGNAISFLLPNGTPLAGNLLILSAGWDPGANFTSLSETGFTSEDSTVAADGTEWQTWYKVSDGTESNLMTLTLSSITEKGGSYSEYGWDGSTPVVANNENITNIDGTVSSQASGALTPVYAHNLMIAMHGTKDGALSFTGQAVDGAWIEDSLFSDTVPSPQCKFSSLVDAALSSQEATHSDTDTGTGMTGLIIEFGVSSLSPVLDATTPGAFSITGVDATLRIAMAADAGAFVVTGVDANLEYGYAVIAENSTYLITGTNTNTVLFSGTGTYAITGINATLNKGRRLTAEIGTYLISGVDTNNVIFSGTGAYSVSGVDANLEYGRSIPAEVGTYLVSGIDANLEYGYTVTAEIGTYLATGIDANLEYGYSIPANAGTYLVSGVNTNNVIFSGTGTYLVTGVDATLRIAMSADAGAYLISGVDATFIDSGGNPILDATTAGTYAINGVDANLEWNQDVVGGTGTYLISGVDANLEYGYAAIAETGIYLINGVDTNNVLFGGAGSTAITGIDATLIAAQISITYISPALENTANLSSYTFSSAPLGAAAADRLIVVGIGARKGGAATTISSVTVAGVTATELVSQGNAGANFNIAALYVAAVPTGTTGNIVVTYGATMVRMALSVYNITGAEITAFNTDSDISADPSLAINIQERGGVIACGVSANNTSGVTWTGLTEDSDIVVESVLNYTSASDEFPSSETARAVSINFPTTELESTGVVVSLSRSVIADPILTAEAGTYLISGVDTNNVLFGNTGTVNITGADANLEFHDQFSSEAGSFSIIGVDANLEYGYAVITETGVFSVTGIDANLEHHYSLSATVIDSLAPSVASYATSSGFNQGRGQSFTGNGLDIFECIFILRKQGTPTGNITCHLFAHGGIFGDGGTTDPSTSPTPLATSNTIDIATLGTTDQRVKFFFPTPYTTVNATNYIITVEYSGGDGSNFLRVGYNNNDLHAGNDISSVALTTWASGAAFTDLAFSVLSSMEGIYSVTGIDANLEHHYSIEALVGTFSITGIDATLTKSGASPVLTADAGTFLVSGIDANLEHHYSITALAGSYSITGIDATFPLDLVFPVDAGVYSINGVAAALVRGKGFNALAGSISVTGIDANLEHGYTVIVNTGSYLITGQNATLIKSGNAILTADIGSFLITGQNAVLKNTNLVTGGRGYFLVTGQNANLEHKYTFTVDTGSFLINGQAANLLDSAVVILLADNGSYSITGQDANLLDSAVVILPAETGSYLINGQDANLKHGYTITAELGTTSINSTVITFIMDEVVFGDIGSFLITGFDATLTKSGNIILTAESGSFLITGFVATLVDSGSDPILTAEGGAVLITGIAAGLAKNRTLTASPGSLVINGIAATLTKKKSITAEIGTVAITGQVANLYHNYSLISETGTVSVIGIAAALLRGKGFNALAGTITISGVDAVLAQGYVMSAETGTVVISGQPVNTLFDHVIPANLGTYTVAGSPATLNRGYALAANLGTYTITGIDVTFSLTGSFVLGALPGTYTIAGQASNLLWDQIITAEIGTVTITGIDAALGAGIHLAAEAGAITIDGVAAILDWDQDIVGGTGAFIITGLPVGLNKGRTLTAAAGSVVITGQDANLEQHPEVVGGVGTFLITGSDITFPRTWVLIAEAGSYSITGFDALFTSGNFLVPDPGIYVISGSAANLAYSHLLPAEIGAFNVTGYDVNFAGSFGSTEIYKSNLQIVTTVQKDIEITTGSSEDFSIVTNCKIDIKLF